MALGELRERVAVVTGGASGIGRALGRRLAAEGMRVVLADVEEPALREAAREIEQRGARCLAVPTDVTDAGAVETLARRTLDAFGAVHLVCNNAGVFAGGPAWRTSPADWEWVLAVNLLGVVHGVRAFVPRLLEQGEGHVVNTASMAALTAAPLCSPYVASKHAVLALSECLYHELDATAVGVSVLCPEAVATRIGDSARNRPSGAGSRVGDPVAPSPEATLVESALREATRAGTDPDAVAGRVVDAVREGRFWVLPEADDPWWRAALARLDDVRARREPVLGVPGAEPPAAREESP